MELKAAPKIEGTHFLQGEAQHPDTRHFVLREHDDLGNLAFVQDFTEERGVHVRFEP